MAKKTSGRGARDLRVKVKSARRRKLSSTLWLDRQLNDPYVRRATAEGYRGRAAFKILELDEKYRFLLKQGSGLKSEEVLEQEKAIERFRSKLTFLIPSIFKQVENHICQVNFVSFDYRVGSPEIFYNSTIIDLYLNPNIFNNI